MKFKISFKIRLKAVKIWIQSWAEFLLLVVRSADRCHSAQDGETHRRLKKSRTENKNFSLEKREKKNDFQIKIFSF